MGIILRLEQGGDVLDLNTGRYCVDDNGFMPPTTAREVTFGRASVGQNLAGKIRANRVWQFEVNIEAASISEVERAIRDLQSFLNRAGQSRSEPLYIAFRGWDGHTLEPYFGQFSAFARYEVVDARAEVVNEYINPATYSYRVPRMVVEVVIKPQALGLPQRCGQAKDTIAEDYVGKITPSGTMVSAPSGGATLTPAGTGLTSSTNYDPRFVLEGVSSTRYSSTTTDGTAKIYQGIIVALGGEAVSFGGYIKMEDGSTPSSSDIRVILGEGSIGTPPAGMQIEPVSMGDGWHYFNVVSALSYDLGIESSFAGFEIRTLVPFYVGMTSLERDATNSIYQYAASSTLPTATTWPDNPFIRYKFKDLFSSRTNWTVRIVWNPPKSTSGTRYFLEDSSDDIAVYIDSSSQIVARSESASSLTSSAITVTAGTPVIIHVTYDGDRLTIYNAGASVGTGTGKTADSAEPTSVYVGSDDTPANYCRGIIMGLAVFSEPMTAAEVLADYTQVAQLASDKQRIDPLPYLWTSSGNDTITGAGSMYLGGLMGDDVEVELYAKNSAAYNTSHGLVFGSVADKTAVMSGTYFSSGLFLISGAGTADAAAYGGAVERQSLNTTALEFVDSNEDEDHYAITRGRELYGCVAYKDAGANLQLRLVVNLGSEKLYSDWRSVASDASNFLNALVGPVTIPDNPRLLDSLQKLGVAIEAKRTTAGAANLDVSHALYLPNATHVDASKLQTPSGADAAYIRGREVVAVLSSGGTTLGLGRVPLMPRPLKIEPNKLNGIIVSLGADGKTWVASQTADFDKISIQPRWDIY